MPDPQTTADEGRLPSGAGPEVPSGETGWWRAVVETRPEGMVVFSPERRVLYANRAASRLLAGSKDESIAGRDVVELVFSVEGAGWGRVVLDSWMTAARLGLPPPPTELKLQGPRERALSVVVEVSHLEGNEPQPYLLTLRETEQSSRLRTADGGDRLARTLRQQDSLLRLGRAEPSSLSAHLHLILQETTETLDVERASIWTLGLDQGEWRLRADFERASGAFRQPDWHLPASLLPVFLRHLGGRLAIVAPRVDGDSRLADIRSAVLAPRGTHALLCAPVYVAGQLHGAIWAEAASSERTWTSEEVDFATALAQHVAAACGAEIRRQTQAALESAKLAAEEASRAKGLFLASMSHELRTPLNGILGYAQILARNPGLGQRERDAVATILESGEHLLGLINDLLDLSKMEAHKLELAPREFALDDLLHGVRSLMAVRARESGIQFTLEVHPQLPPFVLGDDRRIRQVLLNLLSNSLKFTSPGGRVLLQVSPGTRASDVRFEVEDTGVGIAESDRHKLFELFGQVGDLQKRPAGTGLGLAISRNLVQLLGGHLDFTSVLGLGTCFFFEVPLWPVERSVPIAAPIADGRHPRETAPAPAGVPSGGDEPARGEWDLPQAEALALLQLARQGRLAAIREKLAAALAAEVPWAEAARQLDSLARDFKVRALRDAVEPYAREGDQQHDL